MNTVTLNISCWFETFVARFRKPARPKAADLAKPAAAAESAEKSRVRIAGLR